MAGQGLYRITAHRALTADIYELIVEGAMNERPTPGQFVNLLIDGFYLRRPISLADFDDKSMTLIYKVLGKGTAKMATWQVGESVDLLTGLGNGFNTQTHHGKVVLVGGGVGIPPLYALAKALSAQGVAFETVLGVRTAGDLFYTNEFAKLSPTHLVTEDGSMGLKGYVTDQLQQMDYDYYYTCGPMPMLKAVHALGKAGQLSLEERMGCGFGACMGCSCQVKSDQQDDAHYKRLCVEGPVLTSDEVIF